MLLILAGLLAKTYILSEILIASPKFYYAKKIIKYNGEKMTGIYVRVSTDEQVLHGFSIRAQIEKLSDYCKIKDWKIFDIYQDEGISGKNIKDRKELIRLLNDVKEKKITNVLVYKIDRLTRSTKDLIELVDMFNKYNCAFNSLTESIDTLSPTGRMFIKIIGIFAEFERESIVERVKFGLERKVKEGYTIASKNISYGYNKNRGEKIQTINEFEKYIVRKIFHLFLDGYTYTKIAKYLNKYNVKTKNNKNWNSKNIKIILTNPNYVGRVRYGVNKKNYFEIDGKHKSIIENEIFNKVNNIIKKDNTITCECGYKMIKRTKKYYSIKKRKIIKYITLHCTACNKTVKYKM
ncbi:MAG: recombinase family protein [Bacilli bacterium]|nr:recombinase family protein [Bacilli bacterium]